MTAPTRHTILCVDDEKDNVEALERIFRKKYEVLKATSGKEALQLLKTRNVSLIISDQRMPEMTGVQMLAESLKTHPDAIRILLTGYTDIESVIAAVNSGQIYRYVTKPWDPRDLEIAVDRALERYDIGQELKRKNVELAHALSELETLDRTKSHFMILINHELKTPLTSLLSYLDLLKETQLNEEQTLFVNRIGQSSERLKEIIFDVLEFVSAETGQTKITPKPIEVGKLIEELLPNHKSLAEKRKIKVEAKEAKGSLQADPSAIKKILDRLLSNAIKFGDEGSTVFIRTTGTKEGRRMLEIENSGKPMSTDVITKVLKPFAVDENIMNHSKGIGMGLSISQALLKLHASHLDFQSEKGKTKVSFSLPQP